MQKTRIVLSNLFIILSSQVFATELIQEFQSPSFSGNGFGQYVTQIEQTEYQRKKQIEDEKAAKELEMKRQLESSNLYKFLNNVEARIYAELSKKLVDELFGDNPSDHGTIDFEGNTIEYTNDGTTITLKVTDDTGKVTIITIPVGAF